MWLEVSQFLMVCVRWCVLCQAAGQRQRALSVWSGPQRVRSAAVSNITTSSTVAPSLLVRRGRWRRACCLFVCFFVERQLWGRTGFRRHSGLTCGRKQTRKEMWLVRKMCRWGSPSEAPRGSSHQREWCEQCSLESCGDGITTTNQHPHQLWGVTFKPCDHWSEATRTSFPWSPPPVKIKYRKREVGMGRSHLFSQGISECGAEREIWKTTRQLGRHATALIPINPRYTEKFGSCGQRQQHNGTHIRV